MICNIMPIVCTAQTNPGLAALNAAKPIYNVADSVRPYVPPGWIVMTNNGFRKVLTERAELITCLNLLVIKDSTITELGKKVSIVQTSEQFNIDALKSQLKVAKRKIAGKTIELWFWRAGAAFITYKVVSK